MREIEVKIMAIDKKEVIKKLLFSGAKEILSGELEVFYFDFEDLSLRKQGKLLRLRRYGKGEGELTYKEKICKVNGFKQAEEINLSCGDILKLKDVFDKIGLKVRKKYKKRRTAFTKGKVSFAIDEFPGLPVYLEIEGSKKDILVWIEKLGLKNHEKSDASFDELLAKYKLK